VVFGADEKAVFLDSRGMAWECLAQKRIDDVALIGPCEPHTGELGGKGATQLGASREPAVEASDATSGEVANEPAKRDGHNVYEDLHWAAFDSHGYITSFVLYALAGFLAAFLPGLAAARSTAID
jgi:hypothetical protein